MWAKIFSTNSLNRFFRQTPSGRTNFDSYEEAAAKVESLKSTLIQKGFSIEYLEYCAETKEDTSNQNVRALSEGPETMFSGPQLQGKDSPEFDRDARANTVSPDNNRPDQVQNNLSYGSSQESITPRAELSQPDQRVGTTAPNVNPTPLLSGARAELVDGSSREEEITTLDIALDTLSKLPHAFLASFTKSKEERAAPIAEIYRRQGFDEDTANAMADDYLSAAGRIDLSGGVTRGFSRYLFKPKSAGDFRRLRDRNTSKTTDPSSGNTGFKKPVSWPSAKKVKLGPHVDHYEGSPRMGQSSASSGSKSAVRASRKTYERMVRDAYNNSDTAFGRVRQAVDVHALIYNEKITLQGRSGRQVLEMIFNITTGTIETAYPIMK